MDWKILLMIAVPLIFFAEYTYKCYRKLPLEYDLKLVRRVYYIFVVLYITVFILLFKDKVAKINLFGVLNPDLNLLVNMLALFVLLTIWEYVFISCRTFKGFKFKDAELTFEELSKVKYADSFQEKQIKSLYSVLNTSVKMKEYIDEYIGSREFSHEKSYHDIAKKYERLRGMIKVHLFSDDKAGIEELQKTLSVDTQQLASIMYSINLVGFCNPREFRGQKYIFARIETKYIENDLILVMKGDSLIDKEHIVFQDILNYFELKMALEIEKAST